LKLKIAFGFAVSKKCVWKGGSKVKRVMAALAPGVVVAQAPNQWKQEEPSAMALSLATVVALLGTLYHDYSVDADLSGDHVIHRMNYARGETYKHEVLGVLTRAYNTVYQLASAMNFKQTGQTAKQFNDLGLHMHFALSNVAEGRGLLIQLMNSIYEHHAKRNDEASPALPTIGIPAVIEAEYEMVNHIKRMKRQEIHEIKVWWAGGTMWMRSIS
jgi:hypothetical protein